MKVEKKKVKENTDVSLNKLEEQTSRSILIAEYFGDDCRDSYAFSISYRCSMFPFQSFLYIVKKLFTYV